MEDKRASDRRDAAGRRKEDRRVFNLSVESDQRKGSRREASRRDFANDKRVSATG